MATWAGWVGDLLDAAGLPKTAANRRFLNEWSDHANVTTCDNNPLDLTLPTRNSKNCHTTTNRNRRAQSYGNHANAQAAFVGQLASTEYPSLLAALAHGDPYQADNPNDVAQDLRNWTSTKYAKAYLSETGAGPTTGVKAAHAHGGWASLQRSFNHDMPSSLRSAQRGLSAGRHALKRAGKVRL